MSDTAPRFDDLGDMARADSRESPELVESNDAAAHHCTTSTQKLSRKGTFARLKNISRKGTFARLHSRLAREPHKIKPLKTHDEGGVLSPRMARRAVQRSPTVMRFIETHPILRISSQSTAVPEFVHNFIETSIEYMAHIHSDDVPFMLRHWARSTALIVLCVASGLVLFVPFTVMYRLALQALAEALSDQECSQLAAIGVVQNSSFVQNSSISDETVLVNETVFGSLHRLSLPLNDFGGWDAQVRAKMEGSSAGRLMLGAQILRSINTALFSYCTFLLAGWTCFGVKWLCGFSLLISILGGSLHVAIEVLAYESSISFEPDPFMSWVDKNSSWLLILLHLMTGKHTHTHLQPLFLFELACA